MARRDTAPAPGMHLPLLHASPVVFLALAAAGWVVALDATVVGAAYLSRAEATFYSVSQVLAASAPAGSAIVNANATRQVIGTWLPSLTFLGLGIGLVAIVMALAAISVQLHRMGQRIFAELPQSRRPAPPPVPGAERAYPILALVGILLLLGTLIYSAVLANGPVQALWSLPLATISGAAPGTGPLASLGFLSSTSVWLSPLHLVGMAFLFTAIILALVVIMATLRRQAELVAGLCSRARQQAGNAQ